MKKYKVMRWLLLFAGLGFIFFVGSHLLFHLGGWGHRNMAAWQNGGTQMMIFHHGGFYSSFRESRFGGMQGMDGMRHFGRTPGILGLGSILFAIIIAAAGWILRKNAKDSMLKKWIGWLLIGIGTLMVIRRVIPLVLFIIIGIIIWKLVTAGKKERKAETVTSAPSFESITPISSKTGNFLDEWEQKISKEEH